MKKIPLTKGYEAIVDDGDYEELSKYKWTAAEESHNVYAYRRADGKSVKMHTVLVGVPGLEVDHVNRNGLDNRRCNLRACTHGENMRNAAKKMWRGKASSQFKGVRWAKGRWQARIVVDKKESHLGRFSSEIAAAVAYDQAARVRFGKFARLNFPYGAG